MFENTESNYVLPFLFDGKAKRFTDNHNCSTLIFDDSHTYSITYN